MRPRIRTAQVLVLLGILGAHLGTRLYSIHARPLSAVSFYPEHYAGALSLMAGRGFRGLNVDPSADPRPATVEVARFLAGQISRIDPSVFRQYAASPVEGALDPVATSRALDLRLAALVWRFTGPSWPALLHVYALVSMLVNGLLFFLARRLGGFAAGVIASLIILGSPFENAFLVSSVRDLSPYWFAAPAFALLAVATSRGGRATRVMLHALAGAAAALGLGWRTDAFLLPPFVLVSAAATAAAQRRAFRDVVATSAAVAIGAAAMVGAIVQAGGGRLLGPGAGFHTAYYGNFARANLLGIEDGFQTLRDDSETALQVAFYAEATQGRRVEYGGPGYSQVARRLYLETLAYDGYNWLLRYPIFAWKALGGLSVGDELQGQAPEELRRDRAAGLSFAYRLFLDPLTSLAPWFVLVGLTAIRWARDRALAVSLAAFMLLYTATWMLVLPESKHFGLVLLPLAVLGGFGASVLLGALWGRERLRWPPATTTRRVVRQLGLALLSIACVLAGLRQLAVHERRGVLDEAGRLASAATAEQRAYIGPRLFSIAPDPARDADPTGYLLTLRTGRQPGSLLCRHFRGMPSPRLYRSRHPLAPESLQKFFVVALQGARLGDSRPYVLTVTVDGDAEIVAAHRLDASGWKRPLFAGVILPGDANPGSLPLRGPGPSMEYLWRQTHAADGFGLLPDEQQYLTRLRVPEGAPFPPPRLIE